MYFRVLGPLEVRSDHGPVDLKGTRPRAVLAYLLLHANEPVSWERVAEAVWGEDATPDSRKKVQVNVSRVRKALGDPQILETSSAGYQLRVLPGELDSERFEQSVEEGRKALAGGDPEGAAGMLREGLGLWRGTPLADLTFEAFAQADIARLEEQRLAALETRVAADLEAGKHADLVGELRQLVADHPTREQLAGQLMLALYRCGRQAEALQAFQDARRRLVEDIGVEPGPELRELQDAILRQDEGLAFAPSIVELPRELDPAAAPPLAGRASELGRLRERWERVEAGAGALVTLSGPAGIGKSRLAAELAGEVHRAPATVLYASGGGPPEETMDVLERAREATGPTLVVVDGADQADAAVLTRLGDLGRTLRSMPVLVVAAGEDDEVLARLGANEALALEPLDAEAVREIALSYAPEADGTVPVEWLRETSKGLPRRVHELASEWARRQAAERVEEMAGRAAAGRAELRSMEAELAGGVVDLQTTQERLVLARDLHAPVVCPFKGLAPFDESDSEYYFGRERLVAELVARLVGAPLLGVVGPSGSGKSSVVRAGLMPALAGGVLPGSETWVRVLMRPGEHPLAELEAAVSGIEGDPKVVLVVDQFEEIFTACRDEDERATFVAELMRVAEDRYGRGLVVLAIRADHYGNCAAYPGLSQLLADNHVLVGPMRREELRRAVELPAERAGLEVEPALVTALLDDVEEAPGALPLLSAALLDIWQRRDGRVLRHSAYLQTGGVHSAVARLAEDAYAQLDRDQQVCAHSLLVRLADEGPDGGIERRRVPLTELDIRPGGDSERVFELFADRRLLTVSAGSVELAHEALLRGWPRLSSWIEEDRAGLRISHSLTAAAMEWDEHGRDEDALYRGTRLSEADEWRETHEPSLNKLEREFLDASDAHREGEQRARRKRLQVVIAGLAAALGAISVVAIIALSEAQEAEQQRDIAASRQLAAQASGSLEADPGLSLALALKAFERSDTAQAENVLRQATLSSRALSVWTAHDDWVTSVEPSVDGSRVVTAGRDGAVRIWDLARGRAVWSVNAYDGWAYGASLSPDGQQLVTAGEDGEVAVWDVHSKQKRVLLRLPARALPDGVSFSPDGRRVIVPSLDGTIRVVPIDGGKSPEVLRGHSGPVWAAQFSPDGRRAVSASEDGSARVWNLENGDSKVLPHPEPVYSAGFSPDGVRVATAGDDGIVRTWNAGGTVTHRNIRTSNEPLEWVQFSGDGQRLVTAGDDGVVRVLDARGGAPLEKFAGHKGVVMRAAFVPGTDTVVSGGQDRTLRSWASAPTAALQVPVTEASFGPGGHQVLSGSRNGPLRIWIPATGSVTLLQGHRGASFPQFSADGRQIVSAGDDGTARLWDVDTARSQVIFSDPAGVFTTTFDPQGRRIAISRGRRSIVVLGIEGRDRTTLEGHTATVLDVAFNRDGTQLASASNDGTIRLWNPASGKLQRTFRGHRQSVNSVSFSDDGRRLVTAGADGTVRIWSLDGRPTVILRGHEGSVASADLDRSGRRVVSAGQDGTIRVWSATGGETLVVLFRHDGPATSAEFSPSGREVVSAGSDELIRVSQCEVCGPLSAVLRLARSRAERELSPIERQRFLPAAD
jgi:WD40 repeat protein/DNA-binding SARP family transcriptional activator